MRPLSGHDAADGRVLRTPKNCRYYCRCSYDSKPYTDSISSCWETAPGPVSTGGCGHQDPGRKKVKNVKRVMRQQTRFMLTAALTVIGVLAVTGCTNSGNGGAAQLLKQFPWLAPLGLSFVSGLLQQYGSDLASLLVAAAAALVGA
jgi:hypothetical protein